MQVPDEDEDDDEEGDDDDDDDADDDARMYCFITDLEMDLCCWGKGGTIKFRHIATRQFPFQMKSIPSRGQEGDRDKGIAASNLINAAET